MTAQPTPSSARARGSYLFSGLILAAGLALTFVTNQAINIQALKQAEIAHQSQADMFGLRVEKKFIAFQQLLRSAQSFLATSDEIEINQWRRFTSTLRLEAAFPGAVAVGYSTQKNTSENSDLHSVGRYLMPLTNSNRHLIGYDLASIESQRSAMIRARDFAQISLSTKVDLRPLVGVNSPSGLVMYAPVYRGGETPDWIAARRSRLLGFVYLVIDDARIFKTTLKTFGAEIADLYLYDGPGDGTGTLLEKHTGTLEPDETKRFHAKVFVAGRSLTVSQSAPAKSELDHRPLAISIKIGGLLLSLLLALTSWFQIAGQRRERQLISLNEQLVWTQRQAERANLAKSAFLATMSHEIRTPMNGVIGMIDVLASSKLTPGQQENIRTVRQSGLSLLNLIDDILDFSKIESDMLDIERIEFELETLVREVSHSLFTIAADNQVRLSLFLDPRLPASVWGDPTRLKQILFNLVGNAIKFSSKNLDKTGHVSLRFLPDAECNKTVQIEIIDNGIGMAPETIETLFDAFTQAEVSTTRRFGGSGLGLAICKRLINMADGHIAVDSELHCGSEFSIRLPMLAQTAQSTPVPADLEGVVCVLLHNENSPVADLQHYLTAAGAKTYLAQTLIELNDLLLKQRRCPTVVVGAPMDLTDHYTDLSSRLDCGECLDQVLILRAGLQRATLTSESAVPEDRSAICLSRLDLLPGSFIAWAASIAGLRQSPDEVQAAQLLDKPQTTAEIPIDDNPSFKAKILVAEDEPINQQVITRQLEILGYEVDVANNGVDALQSFHASTYTLVLTDLHMPDMDGYELTRAIRRAQASTVRTPILMLSANAINGESARAESEGVDEYLTKPIQIEVLKEALGRWIAGQATSRQPEKNPENTPSRWEHDETEAPPTLDPDVLKGLVDGDQAMASSVTQAFRHSITSAKHEMTAAQSARDQKQIREIAHRLKSSARTVGALALEEVCAQLEIAAEQHNAEATQTLLTRFDDACADVCAAIEAHLESAIQ